MVPLPETEFNEKSRVNSIGLKLMSIPTGTFTMGASQTDEEAFFDEFPSHEVEITHSFEMGVTEITNAQYELFDPAHRKLRGNGRWKGFSVADDEAVVNVSMEDAMAFCTWLSEKEGLTYRLPTEAEWEYCCRAGSTDLYSTGKNLPEIYHKDQRLVKFWRAGVFYRKHSLKVGVTPPNPWGLHDMHGNVENWCLDRFGYYTGSPEKDPLFTGKSTVDGEAYVTRGGSYGVKVEHLRSSRRLGALKDDRNWLIGFRVVCGEHPSKNEGMTAREPLRSLCIRDIAQTPIDFGRMSETTHVKPVYIPPIPYIQESLPEDRIPLRRHNHCPAITWCANGDMLAIWFNTTGEHDRDMVIVGSRLRKGKDAWDPASLFFRVPGRNMTGESLFTDEEGTILHVNGVEVATSWNCLAMVGRVSQDNGETWSPVKFFDSHHRWRNQVICGGFKTKNGTMVQLCDASSGGDGGTAFWTSSDSGETWHDLGRKPNGRLRGLPIFSRLFNGKWIAGIHGKAVELNDGSFLAYGRSNNFRGKMPESRSSDGGKTWKYSASPFPGISWGQRLVLKRLKEGPLLFVSFTDNPRSTGEKLYSLLKGMKMKTYSGEVKTCYGIFAAVSYDQGKTWPVRRFLDASVETGSVETKGFGIKRKLILDDTHGELKGYNAATVSPDGMIHVISSHMHYRFNLKWLES